MKADLLKAACQVVPNQQILVNVISRRVRQLSLGHQPRVEFSPGLGFADIALTEVINNKLGYESTLGQKAKDEAANVVVFPGIIGARKAA